MCQATPVVGLDETLLRQLGEGGEPLFYNPDRSPLVHRKVFLPTRNDDDGLSLIRHRYRADIWAAHRPNTPDKQYRLVRITAQRLAEIALDAGFAGLTIDPTADELDNIHGHPWAHCVIREINRREYEQSTDVKKRIKSWAEQVSQSIQFVDISGPFHVPAADEPYRPI